MTDWSLFALPYVNGLLLALALPLLGLYLRQRDEWLAALAYAHLAAAGSLAAVALLLPQIAGGIAAAGGAALVKQVLPARSLRAAAFPLLLLLGWALSTLLAANLPIAERLGHALFDGQLYFSGREQFLPTLLGSLLALGALRFLSRGLLRQSLFAHAVREETLGARLIVPAFDLLVALLLALATLVMGVMGAFALLFVPPWVAFELAGSWRRALMWSAALGGGLYSLAFVLALQFDQPPGPVLALVLIVGGGLSLVLHAKRG